jgi:hypothetical protein
MSARAEKCPHCGTIHDWTCGRIRRVEYFEDGRIKAVEFHSPFQNEWGTGPTLFMQPDGPVVLYPLGKGPSA